MPVNEPFVPGALLLVSCREDLLITAHLYADQRCVIVESGTAAITGICIASTPHELFTRVLYIVFDDGQHGWVPEAYIETRLD